MELFVTILTMASGVAVWEVGKIAYRVFIDSVDERADYRALNDYDGDYPSKRNTEGIRVEGVSKDWTITDKPEIPDWVEDGLKGCPDALETLAKLRKGREENYKTFNKMVEKYEKDKLEAEKPGTLPCYYEGDKVVRIKGGFVYKGEQGTVVQYSSTKEKYARVQWVNNQTWVSKNCIELC